MCVSRIRPQTYATSEHPLRTVRVYRYSRSNPKMFQPVMMSGSSSSRMYSAKRSSISRSVANHSESSQIVFLTQSTLRSNPSRPYVRVVTATWKQTSVLFIGFGKAPDSEKHSISTEAMRRGAMSSRSIGLSVRQSWTRMSIAHDEPCAGTPFASSHPVDLIPVRCMIRRTGLRFASYTWYFWLRHSHSARRMSLSFRNVNLANVCSVQF